MEKFTNFTVGGGGGGGGVLVTCNMASVAFIEHSEVPEKAYNFTFTELGSF